MAVYTFIKAFYCAFGSAAIHAICVIAFGFQAIAALGVALSAYCLGAGPFRTNFISLLSRYAAQRPPLFEFDGFLPSRCLAQLNALTHQASRITRLSSHMS